MKLQDLLPVSGVYKITNTRRNWAYIGQSMNIKYRLSNHADKLVRGTHINSRLQRDVKFYGFSAFTIEILEECENGKLREREEYWIAVTKERLYNQLSNYQQARRFRISRGVTWEEIINPTPISMEEFLADFIVE